MSESRDRLRVDWAWIYVGLVVGAAILVLGGALPTSLGYVQSIVGNIGVAVMLAGVLAGFEKLIIDFAVKKSQEADVAQYISRTDARQHAAELERIFREGDVRADAYTTTSLANAITLPVLPLSNRRWLIPVVPGDDAPFELVDRRRREFPVDEAAIAMRRRFGGRLWDGSVLYSLSDDKLSDRLPVGVGNYFGYVTRADQVQRESQSSSTGRARPLLNSLSSPDSALRDRSLEPIALAGSVTCVFETGEADRARVVAIQRRSQEVVSGRGLHAVSPVFGMEPNTLADLTSDFGIPFYNLVKEFLEEIFGQGDTARVGDKPLLDDPDAIFRSPEALRLIAELTSPETVLEITGAAIDPSDASLDFMFLAHFKSPEFYQFVRERAVGNWEAEHAEGRAKISFWDIDTVDELMSIDSMVATSIHSLDLARAAVRSREGD